MLGMPLTTLIRTMFVSVFPSPRRAALGPLCLLLALPFVQCTTNAGEDSAASTLSRQDFITHYCELGAPCCAGRGNACESNIDPVVPQDFDSARGQGCLDAIGANSRGAHFCSSGFFMSDVPACRILSPRGNVAIGAACANAVTGVECAPSPEGQVACVYGKGGAICQVEVLGVEGASCVGDSHDDGTLGLGGSIDDAPSTKDTYCDRSKGLHCVEQKCAKQAALGQPCAISESCGAHAYCALDGVCKAVVADGSPCRVEAECESKNCLENQCSSAGPPVFLQILCGR
jgi:hypothetical protein